MIQEFGPYRPRRVCWLYYRCVVQCSLILHKVRAHMGKNNVENKFCWIYTENGIIAHRCKNILIKAHLYKCLNYFNYFEDSLTQQKI